jgi:hypothetical protein
MRMTLTDTTRHHILKGILTCLLIVLFLTVLNLTGCGEKPQPVNPSASQTPATSGKSNFVPPIDGTTLYLAQAQFIYEPNDSEKKNPVPGPARLVIFQWKEGKWNEEVVEDPQSNVFHKAAYYRPPQGEPGILTISATQAHLKLWRKDPDGKWIGESLWNPTFGGKFDRMRDFEVADVTGDGVQDIIIVTHDQGVVAVAYWENGKCSVHELNREGNTFVHEVETGDVDGDGIAEIFTTPSKPNKLDGSVQPGRISRWDFKDGKWSETEVELLESRHAKEILCVTLPGDTRPVLFASLEGERIGGDEEGDTTRIRMYRFDNGITIPIDIASLPGRLCRFLCFGDTDGDGNKELIASTKSSGIWKLVPPGEGSGKEWQKTLIATDTSGFEHATYLFDGDRDGKDEIYVASDDQREMRCYWFNGNRYEIQVIGKLKDNTITFNITAAIPE